MGDIALWYFDLKEGLYNFPSIYLFGVLVNNKAVDSEW